MCEIMIVLLYCIRGGCLVSEFYIFEFGCHNMRCFFNSNEFQFRQGNLREVGDAVQHFLQFSANEALQTRHSGDPTHTLEVSSLAAMPMDANTKTIETLPRSRATSRHILPFVTNFLSIVKVEMKDDHVYGVPLRCYCSLLVYHDVFLHHEANNPIRSISYICRL
jgi:hypothetical protein